MAEQTVKSDYIVSYLTLRKAVGYIGFAMPILVKVGAYALEGIPSNESISADHYTVMRDVLVGTLFAIGVFLFFYRGHDTGDSILTSVAGAAAVGIGLLPMDPSYHAVVVARFPELSNPGCYVNHGPLGYHIYAVMAFFAIVSYISIFQFTKTDQITMTPQKRARNKVYVACGIVMIASFAVIVYLKYRWPTASIFWPETLAIVAFSVSWLTKGQAVLKDKAGVQAVAPN